MFTKKLKSLLIVLLALVTLFTVGCAKDDDDNPLGPENSEYVWVHFEGDSTQMAFDDMPVMDVTALGKAMAENDGIWLKDFISTTLIPNATDKDGNAYEARALYCYRNEGEDGFSASVKGYADNTWDHMNKGYILVDARRVIFPDDLIDLPGAYNTQDVRHIRTFRKFDVITSDSTAFTSVDGLALHSVDNGDGVMENAIALSDLVAPLLADLTGKTFTLTSIDGFTPPAALTQEQFITGYWLLDSKKTIFTHAAVTSGKYKVKFLQSITVND